MPSLLPALAERCTVQLRASADVSPAPPPDELLTVADAARLAGVGERAIRKAVSSGRLHVDKEATEDQRGYRIAMRDLVSTYPHIETGRPGRRRRRTASSAKHADYEARHDELQRKKQGHQTIADERAKAVDYFNVLLAGGLQVGDAVIATIANCPSARSAATLHRFRKAVEGHERRHWAALLAPKWHGNKTKTDIPEWSWRAYLQGRLNTAKTKSTVVYKDIVQEARRLGQQIPQIRIFERRYKELDDIVKRLGTEGEKELARAFSDNRIDWERVPLHFAWETDGRRRDVDPVWGDGERYRPWTITVRECRSRVVLASIHVRTLTLEAYQAAIFHAIRVAGGMPHLVLSDCDRALAAKAASGGQLDRYRFKVMLDEGDGYLTRIGIKLVQRRPGAPWSHGVESYHAMQAMYVDEWPGFEGAYVGSSPTKRPANYNKKKFIPLSEFARKDAEFVKWFNSEHKHTGRGMYGRTANEVMEAEKDSSVLRPITNTELRGIYLARRLVALDKRDYTIRIRSRDFGEIRFAASLAEGNKHWSALTPKRGFQIYWNPYDPEEGCALHLPDGSYYSKGELKELLALDDKEAMKEAGKRKNRLMRGVKDQLNKLKGESEYILPSPVDQDDIRKLADASIVTEEPKLPPTPAPKVPASPWFLDPRTKKITNRETGEVLVRRAAVPRVLSVASTAPTGH